MRGVTLLPRLISSSHSSTFLHLSSIPLRFASTSTPRVRPEMDKSLTYTPDRGTELAENVVDVQREIEAVKPVGSSVSLS